MTNAGKTRKYAAPRLVQFGDMVRLTASGTSSNNEAAPGNAGKKP